MANAINRYVAIIKNLECRFKLSVSACYIDVRIITVRENNNRRVGRTNARCKPVFLDSGTAVGSRKVPAKREVIKNVIFIAAKMVRTEVARSFRNGACRVDQKLKMTVCRTLNAPN